MIHNVVARRGIQAIQLTHDNRYEICDLVQGKLHQRMRLVPGDQPLYFYELDFERDGHRWHMTDKDWMLLSPQGFVAIMDDDSFRSWFETVSLSDASESHLTRSGAGTGDSTSTRQIATGR